MEREDIIRNLENLKAEIADAAKAVGRNPEEVNLIAVSKTQTVDVIRYAYEAGHRMFGENRVQELEFKSCQLPSDIEWHLIGHLQSNKVRKALQCTAWIHSVDSLPLLKRIDLIAGERKNGVKVNILFEINVAKEDTKFGFREEVDVFTACEAALECKNINFCGLMTIAPFEASEKELHIIFAKLRKLKEKLESEFAISLRHLSMGMSGDFKIAIQEGATLIRIGTAIFGKRMSF